MFKRPCFYKKGKVVILGVESKLGKIGLHKSIKHDIIAKNEYILRRFTWRKGIKHQ